MNAIQSIQALRRLVLLALVAGVLVWTGCDSSDNEDDDDGEADQLVGSWEATSIKAGPIDVSALLDVTLTIDLNADGSASVAALDTAGVVGEVSGFYEVDEADNKLILSGPDLDENLIMDYTLVDDNSLTVSFPGSELEKLGIDLGEVGEIVAGLTITAELQRVSG